MIRPIRRNFTSDPFKNVYDLVDWKKVDVEIKDWQTGEVIYEGKDLEFPVDYSQQACEIIASKYFYRNIDGKGTQETSLKQVVHRMVHFWTDALIEEGVITGEWKEGADHAIPANNYDIFSDAATFYDECVVTLLKQMWAPNSPQWFNTGIKYYGIKGDPDKMYYCDKDGVHKSKDRYTRSQTSACFIIPITDHLIGKDSITDHYVTETKLFKGGSGVGTNFSPIRAEGEELSSGGHSSGVMSFLLGLDRNAGAIKSGGTTRRAAKMVILDVDHPDIEEFIDWKVHEEKKARDLMSLGYDGSINGEAYQTVSGQNSNNSVRVNKEFMDKVLGNDPNPLFELKGRKDSKLDRVVDAYELWDKIATAAWECADPGIQFDDKYNEWNTAAADGRINATNPCSEYAFLDNSACNLASINLDKFYNDSHPGLDEDAFVSMIVLIQCVLEASIYWGHYPTKGVAKNSYKYRPTGLGLCNLGTVFLKNNIPYDSDQAREMAADVASIMTATSYLVSLWIAKEIGACEGYDRNKSHVYEVIEKHMEACKKGGLAERFFQVVLDNLAVGYGVRNMQTTVMAPTGTISLAMDCTSTGIEPIFSHKMYKKCSDGSMMEIDNPLVEGIIEDPDNWEKSSYYYDECPIGHINRYFSENDTYQGCDYLTYEAQDVLATANEISPEAHVKMMAAMQPFISGSISKTVNLPNSATVEDIQHIYELAYKLDCKSISIYRDGSKGAQPLNVSLDEETKDDDTPLEVYAKFKDVELPYYTVQDVQSEEPFISTAIKDSEKLVLRRMGDYVTIASNKPLDYEIIELPDVQEPNTEEFERYQHIAVPEEIIYPTKLERKKPDGIRKGNTHTAKIGNVELYVTVSYFDNGDLCEVFVSSDKEGTTIKGLLSSLSKAISHMLQYGIEPEKIAEMLRNQQYEPAGHVERHPYIKMVSSISDFIARVIEYECGDYSRCQIKPEDQELNIAVDVKDIAQAITENINDLANKLKVHEVVQEEHLIESDPLEYTCNECQICHSKRVIPNGTCEVCLDCGSTSGCS